MGTHGDPMGTHEDLWGATGPVGTHGDPWGATGTHGDPWGLEMVD